MKNKNHICTLGDYSKPSHEGYQNTIELPDGNNVVPLRSDIIRTPEKVLVKEEARHLVIKNVNAISLVKMEKEKNTKNNEAIDKNVMGLSELNAIEPTGVVDIKKEVVDEINDKPVKNVREEPKRTTRDA
nr:zinc finger, CCHC-type [Tanacetum cinerariifolium]